MLDENQINDILELSQIEFGEGYLTLADLRDYLGNKNCNVLIREKKNRVVAFSIVLTFPISEFSKHFFVSQQWFKKHFNVNEVLGYRKMTIVRKESQKQGLGRDIVKLGDDYLATTCSKILSTIWKNGNEDKMMTLLNNSGYKEIDTIANYWADDSLSNNYNCQICGEPPCSCSAFIYLKKVN